MTRPPPNVVPETPVRAEWDPAEAARLVRRYALVGVTWVASDNETVLDQGQYHGRVVSADSTTGIVIGCEGRWAGETLTLPPDPTWFHPAGPGHYTLRSTDEIVVDPDLTARWTIYSAPS